MKKRGQVGMEYMIMVGFVTLAIISVLTLSLVYSDKIRDRIRLNQVENFAVQLINSAEAVFFSGEPSKASVSLYLPEGVQDVTVLTNEIVLTTTTSSGTNVRAFESKVPLSGSITAVEGIKRLTLTATSTQLVIS